MSRVPRWLLATLAVATPGGAQKGLASLNDPCDCMQNHDFWVGIRGMFEALFFSDGFERHVFDPSHKVHAWITVQSCMYSPDNEESHRPTALSDCIPGFLMVHITCMQRHLVERRPEVAMEYAAELMRLLPWGFMCHERSGWPLKPLHVRQYYRRLRRAYAAGPGAGGWTDDALRAMAWSAPVEHGTLGEAPEVCPYGSLPKLGACWVLGAAGASCGGTCAAAGMQFHSGAGHAADALLPHVLGLWGPLMGDLAVQVPWGPFECYVSSEQRFHLAGGMDFGPFEDWSYPLCELVCPCSPSLPDELWEALGSVPDLELDLGAA